MKVILPVENRSLHVPVCPSFGRTPWFVSYDTDTGSHEYLNNAATASQGGAGIKAAQLLADHGAKAVITYRLGENAAKVLHAAGIELFMARDGTVMEHIEKFKNGALARLLEIHPGLHHHGG
jgi:predicted Fe-Mo cluster-binding NifX family protein